MRPAWADPSEDFIEMTERLYRLLDNSVRWQGEAAHAPSFSPAMDILDTGDEVVILAEVPGMSRDQINVQVDGAVVTISGDRTVDDTGGEVLVRERAAGNFNRSFSLAYELDPDRVSAKMENGLLRVSIPRRSARSVDVK